MARLGSVRHFVAAASILGLSSIASTRVMAAAPDPKPGGSTTAPSKQDQPAAPAPELSPDQVVKLQMEALQNNDDKDGGIETAFRFASPENKTQTGPIEHFVQLVKSEGYAPMLGAKSLHFEQSHIKGDRASVVVILTSADGKIVRYQFILSRQSEGELKGCWMTDGVGRLPDAEPPKNT